MPEAHPREFRDDVVAVARLGDAPVGPMPFKPSSPVSVSMEDLDQLFVGLLLASVDPLEIYDEFHRDSFAGLPSQVPRTNASQTRRTDLLRGVVDDEEMVCIA